MTIVRPDFRRHSSTQRGYALMGWIAGLVIVFMVVALVMIEYRAHQMSDMQRPTITEKLAHFLWELEQPQNWR